MNLVLAILLLVTIVHVALAYSCNTSVCKLPACKCPTNVPPGGLSAAQTPQLIMLTYDVHNI